MTATNTDPIEDLIAISRFYGSDPTIVLAGGGNTSVKIGNTLHVKASGYSLATIGREGFVSLDRSKLEAIANADFGTQVDAREAKFKDAIMASRLEPQKGQRPSVEALLHHLTPGRFVVHSHATIVNMLTCAKNGETLAKELFGDEVLWLPIVDPGFTLGQALKQGLASFRSASRKAPKAILMANHGLVVASDDLEEIRATTNELIAQISARLDSNWETSLGPTGKSTSQAAAINTIAPALRALSAEGETLKVVAFDDAEQTMSFVNSATARDCTSGGPLNPDQIVYCNSFALWFELVEGEAPAATVDRLRTALAQHQQKTRFPAKIVLVPQVGLFAIGDDVASAGNARALYLDAIRIMTGAARLGGSQSMPRDKREFIENWEVEAYRRQISQGAAKRGRVAGRIAIVTGAAQGFGLEIAQQFAAEGGIVVLTDINEAGAKAAAAAICAKEGKGRAIGLPINVTSTESVAACVHQVVRTYGGFDALISNAGVLKAESVKTQSEKDFDFVTAVNYKGYFCCVQKSAPVLAIQRKAKVDYFSDIIQINSKSGLQGSNKNAAYAGSKFGGIGLTQSFALELIEDGVKVNSICPGNFFDGPLWSDPNNGLFVQYLRTGKVPGAKSVADVRKFYEAKVPMLRGCTTPDVMKAIFYLIDQKYETGQALPVTGGQVMLN